MTGAGDQRCLDSAVAEGSEAVASVLVSAQTDAVKRWHVGRSDTVFVHLFGFAGAVWGDGGRVRPLWPDRAAPRRRGAGGAPTALLCEHLKEMACGRQDRAASSLLIARQDEAAVAIWIGLRAELELEVQLPCLDLITPFSLPFLPFAAFSLPCLDLSVPLLDLVTAFSLPFLDLVTAFSPPFLDLVTACP